MPDIFAQRRQRLTVLARAQGLVAIAFVPGANFTGLTGLHFPLMGRPHPAFHHRRRPFPWHHPRT